jgi:hypothetical protein
MRPTRTTLAPLAAVLAAATLAAPATARPIDATTQPARTDPAYALPRDFVTADVRDADEGRGTYNAPPVIVVKVPQPAPARHDGVDWAHTAIGAGGATGLLAISLAGAITLRRRESSPHTRAAIG